MPIISKKKNIFFIIGVIIILLIFLHGFGLIKPIENGIIKIFMPLQRVFISFSSSTKNFFSNFASLEDLQRENQELKDEINKLTVENNYVKTLLEENKIIDPQVTALQERNYSYVLSRVISRGVDPTFKTMVINRGLEDGIQENMPVITDQAVIIGKIAEVENSLSHVMLLNDVRSKTASQIQNESSSQGIITGEFGLNLKMELIPKEDQINNGQTVITSGLENSVPKGLVVGEIKSVKKQSGDFFQTAYVKPLIDYDQTQIVSVITHF